MLLKNLLREKNLTHSSASALVHKLPSKTGSLPIPGPEEPGVYSVCYNIKNDHVDFIVSRLEASGTRAGRAEHMYQAVREALLDMRTLLEQAARAKCES